MWGRELHLNWVRDNDRDGPVIGFFRDLGGGISSGDLQEFHFMPDKSHFMTEPTTKVTL